MGRLETREVLTVTGVQLRTEKDKTRENYYERLAEGGTSYKVVLEMCTISARIKDAKQDTKIKIFDASISVL
jgi:hypothetical protein